MIALPSLVDICILLFGVGWLLAGIQLLRMSIPLMGELNFWDAIVGFVAILIAFLIAGLSFYALIVKIAIP